MANAKARRRKSYRHVRFEVTRDGLFAHPKRRSSIRVCDPISVEAIATEEGGAKYVAVIKFRDHVAGSTRREFVPLGDLRKSGILRDRLSNSGFAWPGDPAKSKLLIRHLNMTPERRCDIALRTGWFGERYVLPDQIIGSGDREIMYQPTVQRRSVERHTSGRLAGWKQHVAIPLTHSSRGILSIGVSFAALIIGLTDTESGGFHLFDERSSVGKTTLLLAANSVIGSGRTADLLHWDITATGQSEIAAEHCDMVLALDETARLSDDPKDAASAARKASYMLASGVGRIRSVFFGDRGNLCSWRVLFLSSGETGISELAHKAGRGRLKGDQVRLIDVPAVVDPRFGVFESLPDGFTASRLLREVRKACARYYGTPGRAFLKDLIAGLETHRPRLLHWCTKFDKIADVPEDNWERRFSSRFALAYAALRLAAKFDIVPWTRKQIRRAIISCYRDARRAVPDAEKLTTAAVATVRRKLRKARGFLDLRNTTVPSRRSKLRRARGFIKRDRHHGTYFVIQPTTIRAWIGERVSLALVLERLKKSGDLITTSRNTLTKQVLIPGLSAKRRYHCVKRRFIAK